MRASSPPGSPHPAKAHSSPPTPRYFYVDSLVAVWNNRPRGAASTIVTGLYPTWDTSQDGIDAAEVFLARPDVRAPLVG